jgi:hypothetical protein
MATEPKPRKSAGKIITAILAAIGLWNGLKKAGLPDNQAVNSVLVGAIAGISAWLDPKKREI